MEIPSLQIDPNAKGNGIDKIAEAMLPDIGYAIDVGANNGICLSNTKLFEDKGWTVLCVEPNPMLSEEGRKNRKLWAQVACGPTDAESIKFTCCGVYPWAAGSGFHAFTNDLPKIDYEVPMRRLDTLLDEFKFPRIDLLSIDVEWAEMEVLRGIDLQKWKPKVIICEALAEMQAGELKAYLISQQYDFVTAIEFDHLFKLRE